MELESSSDIRAADAPPTDSVLLSPRAIARVRVLLEREKRPASAGLRLSVSNGGCSGMQYVLGFADTASEGDVVYEYEGVKVFVDAPSAPYLKGMTVDYSDGLHGAGFRFTNPNADRTCGCGSSFSV